MTSRLWRWLAVMAATVGGVLGLVPGVAMADDTASYSITYKTDAGHFSNGTDTNAVRYRITGRQQMTKYSHTSNIDDSGNASGAYAPNLDSTDTVTIPGAESLTIDVWYSTESANYDWLAIYPAGVTPSRNNYSQASVSGGRLGGGSKSTKGRATHATYSVSGDTAQFYFRSDGSGNYYGYYAVVTGEGLSGEAVGGTYEEPTDTPDGWTWKGWFSDEAHSTPVDPTALTSDATVWGHSALYDHEGACGGVSWGLKASGELHFWPTNGTDGTFASNPSYNGSFWPWYQYRKNVTSVTSEGTIHGSQNVRYMFSGCSGLADVSGLASWDTSSVMDMSYMFFSCDSLADVSVLADWDTSSVTSMGSMFNGCSKLADVSGLADWDVSHVTSMGSMFDDCSNLTRLSMENWDTSKATNTSGMFSYCPNLSSVTLGPKVTSSVVQQLPTPRTTTPYTGKWVREDESYGPYTVDELASNWNGDAMSGTWVWETVSYRVSFDANGGAGSMSQLEAAPSVTVPVPTFRWLGYRFLGWNTSAAGTGTSYLVGATLTPTSDMTLYAIWQKMPTTVEYSDGMDITLTANQQVTIENLPAGATYVVTETPVPSGWTLVRSQGTTGVIVPGVG